MPSQTIDMTKPLTTADVPPQFLAAAFLVGHIPQRALNSDPRVSYSLYIPPKHYNPDPSASVDGGGLPKLRLLVSIHGSLRDLSASFNELIPFADATPCAILSPLFPAGLDGPYDLDSYKLLRSRTLQSDVALLSILDEVAQRWPGIDTEKFFLMGFSGGGQFTHRFLSLYPERLAAASVGAPGSVTLLDKEKSWPVGIRNVDELFGRSVQPELMRSVAIQLVVGGADVEIHGKKEFWAWLKEIRDKVNGGSAAGEGKGPMAEKVTMTQGRVETIRQLKSSWEEHGIHAQLDVVEGVKHDKRGVRDAVLVFMAKLMQQ